MCDDTKITVDQEDHSTSEGEGGFRKLLRNIQKFLRRLLQRLFGKKGSKEFGKDHSPSPRSSTSGRVLCRDFEEFCRIDLDSGSELEPLERDRGGSVRWGRGVPERCGPLVPSAMENCRVLRSAALLWERNCPRNYPLILPDWRPILKRPLVEQQVAVRFYVQKVSDMLFSLSRDVSDND